MNTKLRWSLCVVAVVPVAWLAVRAADPPAATDTGHILLLANERTLEGDVERHGDQYRVRRTIGETWVPADKALCLCENEEGAYAYLRTRANLADADERLRLANWCYLHGLRKQALDEVTAAVTLRPGHAESQRLLRSLQRTATSSSTTASAAEKPEPEPNRSPAVDLNADSLTQFITRVHPILMNACVSCHVSGRGGAFQLSRGHEGIGATSRKTVQQNLAAVLAQLTPAQAEASPLLIKALSAHGDVGQPPLKGKQTPAYRTLEGWVQRTVASNPQLHNLPATASPAPSKLDPAIVESVSVRPVPPKAETTAFASERKPDVEKPAAPVAAPADPFDPAAFNQLVQPPESKDTQK